LINSYSRLLNAIPKLTEAELACDRRSSEVAEIKNNVEKHKALRETAGLSDEARQEMKRNSTSCSQR